MATKKKTKRQLEVELTDALANTVFAYTKRDQVNCPKDELPMIKQGAFYLYLTIGRVEEAITHMNSFIDDVNNLVKKYNKEEN